MQLTMRHPYVEQRDSEGIFTDLLFNVLLGFSFLFVTAFALITDPFETGKVDPNAEVLITVTWADNHPDDVDAIVEDPNGNLVWYYNKETSLMHLDRDDRGNLQDLIQVDGVTIANPVNQETVTIRALTPGEYVVNLLHYRSNFPDPLPVAVKVEKLNPRATVEYYGQHELTGSGTEITAVRFTVSPEGELTGLSRRPKPLIVSALKAAGSP